MKAWPLHGLVLYFWQWKKMKFANSILNLFTFLKGENMVYIHLAFLSTLSSLKTKFKGFCIPYLKYSFLRITCRIPLTPTNAKAELNRAICHKLSLLPRMLSVEKQIELITEPLKSSLPSLTSYSLVCSQPRSI